MGRNRRKEKNGMSGLRVSYLPAIVLLLSGCVSQQYHQKAVADARLSERKRIEAYVQRGLEEHWTIRDLDRMIDSGDTKEGK